MATIVKMKMVVKCISNKRKGNRGKKDNPIHEDAKHSLHKSARHLAIQQ